MTIKSKASRKDKPLKTSGGKTPAPISLRVKQEVDVIDEINEIDKIDEIDEINENV